MRWVNIDPSSLWSDFARRPKWVRPTSALFLLALFLTILPAVEVRAQYVWIDPKDWVDANEQQLAIVKKVLAPDKISPRRVVVLRFEGIPGAISSADLFEVRTDEGCESGGCTFYVLTTDPSVHEPFLTDCKFVGANLSHAFHADRSKIYVFDFLCPSASLQVQLSKEHLFVTASEPRK